MNAKALSSLSKMMVDCTREALLERDYANALEYALAVASVDEHPDVTAALAVTVLDIINAIYKVPEALTTKRRLLRALSTGNVDPGTIRGHFLDGTALHVLELTRCYEKVGRTKEAAQTNELIYDLNQLIFGRSRHRKVIHSIMIAANNIKVFQLRPFFLTYFIATCVGAIFGALVNSPIETATHWAGNILFHGREYFKEGIELRREAMMEGNIAKHKAANTAFERAAKAGFPKALFQLGAAYCQGLGVPREELLGQKIAESAMRDSRVGRYLNLSNLTCQEIVPLSEIWR